jgi:hypothetical protein
VYFDILGSVWFEVFGREEEVREYFKFNVFGSFFWR